MQEHQQAAVGIDIGTTSVRCAIGLVKADDQTVSLVGIGEAANTGFRKGSVVNIEMDRLKKVESTPTPPRSTG